MPLKILGLAPLLFQTSILATKITWLRPFCSIIQGSLLPQINPEFSFLFFRVFRAFRENPLHSELPQMMIGMFPYQYTPLSVTEWSKEGMKALKLVADVAEGL
jgi:hypothetical protein